MLPFGAAYQVYRSRTGYFCIQATTTIPGSMGWAYFSPKRSLSLSLSRYPVEFDDTYVQRVRCAVGKDENCCATLGKQGTPRLLISDRFLADVGILQGVYMWE